MPNRTSCCASKGRARSKLTQLDDEEPEVIEKHRSEERTELDEEVQR
jgi:hypothetical protein